MTVTDIRPHLTAEPTASPESARVAELQEMIRSGRYAGYLAELTDELERAKAARAEVRDLTATTVLAA
ncbi:hypothetical protein ACQP2Y_21225 [Actinoplanes sp. CA-051413]|uniref:hypothetical protein n=1 Tax=Actinoplanes sp. CA-051413 TaxID=3239899 RepID=UPI003D962485